MTFRLKCEVDLPLLLLIHPSSLTVKQKRFSLVATHRKVSGKNLDRYILFGMKICVIFLVRNSEYQNNISVDIFFSFY